MTIDGIDIDTFAFCDTNVNLDFDFDGEPGGTTHYVISGTQVPVSGELRFSSSS